ncbi:MAG: insulinase family protein [Paludibacteraceae bacterium]|nr:insulinase family protein [Paludibacteraceae bacterium]
MNDTFYHNLPNGVQIVHRKTTSPVVYVGIMIGAGTRHELPNENGMAHYIEHCVFKGTEHYTARQIINHIEGIGGEINAYTTKEETTFYAATLRNHFRTTLHLLADMVLHPTFNKKETDKEVTVILDEIESYNDSPSELIYDDFENMVFEGTSLAMPILGTKKTLRRISKSPDIALNWMKTHYRPERMVLFVLGNITTQQVISAAEKELLASSPYRPIASSPITHSEASHSPQGVQYPIAYSTQSGRPIAAPAASCSSPSERPVGLCPSYSPSGASRTYRRHTHQTHIMLGSRSYPIGHPKQLTMYLLNNILGGSSMSSRLYLSLREKYGLVYNIDSQAVPLSDTGYWNIYLACEPQHRDQCLELCHKELKQLRDLTLTSAQLQRALRQLEGQMAISAENQENNALAMAKQMLYYHHAPAWQETFAKVKEITPAQLQEVANEVFAPEKTYTLLYD